MKITAEPRSDQYNADDFIGSPRTFTVANVENGAAEQKYDIELAGEGRVWRPPLTMLRLLIHAWGDETDEWIGRRVTLYRDESIRFGSDEVGGVRISHMSNLPGNRPLTVKLTKTRGRRQNHTVEPLPDGPPAITQEAEADFQQAIAAATTLDELEGIAAELKALNLGTFKKPLLAAWSTRQTEIKASMEGADQ